LDAFAIHGGSGVWGVLAAGLMVNSDYKLQYYGNPVNNRGNQFAAQICGMLAIIAWTCALSILFFGIMAGYYKRNGKNFLREEELKEVGKSEQDLRNII